MNVTLTRELQALVKSKVRSGRYVDESDVVRDALRALEAREDYESPALEAALLEGVRSPHRTYSPATLMRVRKTARALWMKVRVSISGRAEADLAHQYRWYLENAGAGVAENLTRSPH